MTKEELRLNAEWYKRRSNNIMVVKKHLIKMIAKHKTAHFPFTNQELKNLRTEDLAEIAIATVNKNLSITLGAGSDMDDNSEVKLVTSNPRNNVVFNKRTGKSDWTHSYNVTGTKNKKGALRIIAYNTILKEFEYFFIPAGEFDNNKTNLEIIIERYSVTPNSKSPLKGYNDTTSCKWYNNVCDSFEEMALLV
jgi:hypothetical protein